MKDERELQGKVAVVTGGAKGLGEGISLAFARAGADVAVISRTHEDLSKIYNKVRALDRKAVTHCGDISNENDVGEFIEDVISKFGRIDFLVNNAAQYLERDITGTTADDWNTIIATNLTGTFLITKAVVNQMKTQHSGHIFTISSVGGRIGLSGKAAYCASKFGVTGFSKALAKELKEFGIKVQIMYPYFVDSHGQLNEQDKPTDPLKTVTVEDVADMIIYHASLPLGVLTEDIIFEPYKR